MIFLLPLHRKIWFLYIFFSQEIGIVLHLERGENRESSEIHQVQYMISDTELMDRTFTLDTLHSSRVTPQKIIDSNNDYLITLKANQLNKLCLEVL